MLHALAFGTRDSGMTTHTETMWAIAHNEDGLYIRSISDDISFALTKKDAITEHLRVYIDYTLANRRRIWWECRKRGDRAVKVTITYEYPE